MSDTITLKNADKFNCKMCNFVCCKQSDWNRHNLTRKHTNRINLTILEQQKGVKNKNRIYNCKSCNKEYKARNSLWYHEQKCDENKDNENNIKSLNENTIINECDIKSLILELVKSNTDLHKQMLEVCKNSNNTTNNMNNCNNKTFNMQVFLNEKCKDAMNLTDFVNSMTLQFSDLEELGELGYVEGISRQMVRKLNEMDVYKRPIHCSDLKRETMYVRDNDVWEKETELYDKLRKAIKYITKKNGDLMIPWRDAHPQCMKLEHPLNDVYLRIMNQAMGGKGEFNESESKIIRKISKCVTIDKSDI
jgi:hypothetical protein